MSSRWFVLWFLPFFSCTHTSGTLMSETPNHKITTEIITYRVGAQTMRGYLAKPENLDAKAAGVLVVHEWWGQTEYPRERARMLARQGYVALAVDMYGDGATASHPKQAAEFSSLVMKDAATVEKPFAAALTALKERPEVDPERIAAIGYCFGGSVVLEMARQGQDLKVVASFHGGLKTPSKAKRDQLKAAVLVFNGAADPFVKKDQIANFKSEMADANAQLVFKNYEGAVHGFTNPEASENGKKYALPLSYDPKADQDSWQVTMEYFRNNL